MRDAPSVERSNGENAQELARRIKAQEGIELGIVDIEEIEEAV
jgi:hypothetical protein